MQTYQRQHRGDRGAYERYLAGMDASMKQKVALTAAHLLTRGRVADMGMGSGAGSFALASLYPALEVVGVDVNPTMVELAADTHRLPNLSFQVGDISRPCFPPGWLDAIFDSSVLHHVTTFNGYSYAEAERCLTVQTDQLRMHGTLIVRDFVAPEPGPVWLDLPAEDGPGDDPRTCSTAALFERFAREFRKLRGDGFPYQADPPGDPPPRPGWRRFQVDRRHAVEFVLRKDYREDWETEVLEEYLYFTQTEFEQVFARLGLRVLASNPLRNPWILRHRFRDRFDLYDASGTREEDPPTNYVIVGERVPPEEGVGFHEVGPSPPLAFLHSEHYRDRRSGKLRDLVRRPNLTVDVVPWFDDEGDLYVVARRSYPRP
ncbi:MAG: methyltransferase domain-containing protein, partial [Candidatus Eremiobacterota bacterium]